LESTEHAASCPECRRFVEERKNLAKLLQLVRDSVPPVPLPLDQAVLEGYRRFLSGQYESAVPAPSMSRISLRGALGWAAAVAFACAVSYIGIVWFIPHPRGHLSPHAAERQPVIAPQMRSEVKPAVAARAQQPSSRKITAHAAAYDRKHPISVAEQDTLLGTRFQSLIYCDPFSCPSAMDVIRLELPSPILGVTPASARAHAPVAADVLVGPDGIARGIRVVE
jgi:hypothetical protein